MYKFTHIQSFAQVARGVAAVREIPEAQAHWITSPVRFRGTVKLHGANAGVACSAEQLVAQSRNRQLQAGSDDHMEFAAFVAGEARQVAIRTLEAEVRSASGIAPEQTLIFFGEWIGPRVQRGVALRNLPERQWVIFGVAASDSDGDGKTYLDALPQLGDRFAEQRIFSIIDVASQELEVDFDSRDSMQAAVEKSQAWVDEVEKVCPWAQRFGIEGIGEGIVWIPIGEHWGNSDLYWKAKGEAHKKQQKRLKPSIDPQAAATVELFVDQAVTLERLEQGIEYLTEMGKPIELRSTGDFLRWLAGDVQRECAHDLEASNLEWKQVGKAVNARALSFYKERCQAI